MIAFARGLQSAGTLETFVHVGTAFVAGERTDLLGAEEPDLDAGFRNARERRTAEAEQMVRGAMGTLPKRDIQTVDKRG